MQNLGRVAHLTFPKCGSQWVRNVLTDSRIRKHSGFALEEIDHRQFAATWRTKSPSSFVGPVYNIPLQAWGRVSRPEDRAVVVLRDPRDQIVSWIFSLLYSHRNEGGVQIFRDLLRSLEDRARLALICEHWRSFHGSYRSWVQAEVELPANLLVTSYEAILADQKGSFRQIIDFFGWKVPRDIIEEVVEAHSFERLSGRPRGLEDVDSHLRKATVGDWRSYFDSITGRFFETRYSGLLSLLGYEKDPHWYESLSESPLKSFSRD